MKLSYYQWHFPANLHVQLVGLVSPFWVTASESRC
ncbi:hypothetical protein CA13_53410 [Planctomycetes bacterium CA13]|uniref:Uncharacterized protein n=1 Tax=Novipirellula herctigrandis TaxID=2527986 RepID=A0A5C5Z9J3_9BACT|nr:hypothetical protein CA13_53410 [Planctomycetes bacterium CA13]